MHRANTRTPPYPAFGIGHSFLAADAESLPTGRIVRVTTQLFATSVRVPAGYALRLRVAGADAPTFEPVPSGSDTPRWHIYRGPTKPSSITVPMAPYSAR